MINIAICDNELLELNSIVKILHTYERKSNVDIQMNSFTNPQELLNEVGRFDIILLDVKLGEENGIELAKKIRIHDKKVKIIFITGCLEYMRSAFGVHAFGFLLKPVKAKELEDIVTDAIVYSDKSEELSVKFQGKNRVYSFYTHEIAYFEYYNRTVIIHTIFNTEFELPGEKISNIAERMKDYHFEVPHKSFVVNLEHVNFVKGYLVHMKDKRTIPLSQLNSKSFRKVLQDYVKQQI